MGAVGNVFRDEKLRAVGVRAGIRISQAPRAVKSQARRSLVLEFVARIALATAQWISALNHEFRNHAMENRPVVKRNPVHLSSARWIGPVLGASCKANEVRHPERRLVRKQRAG